MEFGLPDSLAELASDLFADGQSYSRKELIGLFNEYNKCNAKISYDVYTDKLRVSSYLIFKHNIARLDLFDALNLLLDLCNETATPPPAKGYPDNKESISGLLNRITRFITECYNSCISYSILYNQYNPEDFSAFLNRNNDSITLINLDKFNNDYLAKFSKKAFSNIKSDPEAAITAARTLVETACKFALYKHCDTTDYKGELLKLGKATIELLPKSTNAKAQEALEMMHRGNISFINGLSALRNEWGDSHGKGPDYVPPKEHHAQYAVNAAVSFAQFIISSLVPGDNHE